MNRLEHGPGVEITPTESSVDREKRGVIMRIFKTIGPEAIFVIPLVGVILGLLGQGVIKKYTGVDILEVISHSPGTLHAKLRCDGNELYISQQGNRIICYETNGKAPTETLKTPGLHIPEVKIWDKVIIPKVELQGGYKIKDYEPWWNHKIIVIDGVHTIFQGTYGDYVKSSPGCSVKVTWSGATKAVKDLDFKEFTTWTKQMDKCRSQLEPKTKE